MSTNITSTQLSSFVLERVLNDDAHGLALLGTVKAHEVLNGDMELGRQQAVVRIDHAPLNSDVVSQAFPMELLADVKMLEQTDIYSWYLGWMKVHQPLAHLKISVICPATDVHIRKYSKQTIIMVHETPELYQSIVQPYINAFPAKRVQWVKEILSGNSEADKVLYSDPNEESGFLLIPDMKWDLSTVATLYLVALVRTTEISSMRDLRKDHVGLLCRIRDEASRVCEEKWGLRPGELRMFIHYQPSYYHFHVHIVNANHVGWMGSTVGQAHLLDDVINLLQLDPDVGPSIMERRRLTYGIGTEHGLFAALQAAHSQ